jgi:hypothetical protein
MGDSEMDFPMIVVDVEVRGRCDGCRHGDARTGER